MSSIPFHEIELISYKEKTEMTNEKEETAATNGSEVLSPGSKIKPEVGVETVKSLVERLYGISVLEIKELNSYDDKNYKITEDRNIKNPLITNRSEHGYVVKIVNSMDSEKLSFVDAQNEVLNYLHKHSIVCPVPIRNVYGHYFSQERIGGKNHVVRLLEYQPGELLANVPASQFLLYQAGEYVSNLDRLLKGFYHSGLDGHKHIWMLESIPEVEPFKSSIKDTDKLEVIDEVLADFQKRVLPNIQTLERGVIHGDFNEQNILVNLKQGGNENDWRVSAVLDFGDMQVSCYLFELAITMAYSIVLTGDLQSGGYVLAGYTLNRILSQEEYGLLKICIAARLVQSLILGAYTYEQDPKNEYVLITQKKGWEVLFKLWKEDTEEDITETWKKIADDYLTRSNK